MERSKAHFETIVSGHREAGQQNGNTNCMRIKTKFKNEKLYRAQRNPQHIFIFPLLSLINKKKILQWFLYFHCNFKSRLETEIVNFSFQEMVGYFHGVRKIQAFFTAEISCAY
jgi:hypothetical protein